MICSKICNFCFQENLPNIVSIDSQATECNAHQIQDVVTKHFWFTEEELAGLTICTICWSKMSEFHTFYCQVEQLWKQERSEHMPFTEEKLIPESSRGEGYESRNAIIKTELVDNEKAEQIVCEVGQEEISNIIPDPKEEEQPEVTENQYQQVKQPSEELEKQSEHNVEVTNQDILQFCQMDCKDCSECFVSFKQLKQHHNAVHNQPGYVMCCNFRFEGQSLLREHIRVHMNPATFHCSECNRNFNSRRSLLKHQLSHVPDEQKTFACNMCPKKFSQRYKLNSHMLGHKDEKDFPCQNCDKRFSTRGALASHYKNIHERANEVMCEVCSKVLKTRSAFLIHKAVHINAERIQCSTCGKWLKNEHSMKKHMIRHQEETRDHVCDTCGKRSPNSHALRKHIQDQHTIGRIHQCSLCEKSFKRALALKEHMATHTGQQLYSCPHCGKEFKSSANLYSHRKKEHPLEWQEYQRTKASSLIG
ncbi:transcription factor grauzone-like [Toxorhynchites rutilus septentrionalis]|uniref:transcription factor grauzone-like n=1 Tax=Toxorhynchites rutilus septentrionalis TaxID=329112 RepID=UPI0024791DAE|nr:transcription factor grauzone-like [Toxorhynchites rutilus septentrionalis]